MNPLIKGILRLGIPMGPATLLTGQGRKSGKLRTTPVALMKMDDRSFLLGTFGDVNWVKNLRSAGTAKVGKGSHRYAVTAKQLSPEQALPIFKSVLGHYLQSRMMRSALSMGYQLGPNSTDEDFMREALRHPAFEIFPATFG